MIARLEGKVVSKKEDFLVVMVGGLGFKVFVSAEALEKAKEGDEISLFTFLAVRENALELFGFLSERELEFFMLLISVSGIGPKGAMRILDQATPGELQGSILEADSSILTKVSGIGTKTAERIILELKNKLGKLPSTETQNSKKDLDALEALVSLGYSSGETRQALKSLKGEEMTTEERVRQAIKFLSRGRH